MDRRTAMVGSVPPALSRGHMHVTLHWTVTVTAKARAPQNSRHHNDRHHRDRDQVTLSYSR
eukprot:3592607-Rhodomonas_salina.1